MDPYNVIRMELGRMRKRDLLGLTWYPKIRWCNIGARECGFFIHYNGFGFCLTELLGKGCSPDLEPGDEIDHPNQW